jgi:Tfp pilus assembly protein PilF/outer membrane protein OmpA-like peptidoglycan-associated protein
MKKAYTILKQFFILTLVAAVSMGAYAQDEGEGKAKKPIIPFSPYWFIQGEIGPSFGHADLSATEFFPDFNNVHINGAIGGGRQFTKVTSLYINLERGFFKGEREAILSQNLPYGDYRFLNDYYGGNINVGINLSNWWGGYKDRLVTFAIHAGVGQAQWKSQTYDLNTDAEVITYGLESSPESNQGGGISNRKVALTVPVGATVNFHINDRWDVYGDYVYNWMDTDVADGVIKGSAQVYSDVYSHFNIGARLKFGANKAKKMAENFDQVQLVATPDPLEEVGDSVEVTIKGTFPPKYFDKKAVMCFTPVLKYKGGETEFETMNFKGEAVEGDGIMISEKNGGSFTYTAKVPYDPAMDVSELDVQPVVYQYNGEVYEACADAEESDKAYKVEEPRKLADGVIHTSKYVSMGDMTDFAPDGYELITISSQYANVFFMVNRANVNMNLPLNKDDNNAEARDNVTGDMDKGWEVDNITIDGWASPEGEETFNQDLSMKRAENAGKYMKKKIDKDQWENIEVIETANGPDWNGFMQNVEASDHKDKAAILNVIRSAGTAAEKEEEIRNMILIYPELQRDFLPPLRRAVIAVNTFEPKRSKEEIASLATSDPGQLELNELLYAATLTDDLDTKRRIYASVMENHPKCYRGYNNAAAVELEDGNTEVAKEYLDKAAEIKDDSYQVWNNYGVYYAMTGDWKKAEEAFEKAGDLGGNVNYNMGIVSIHNGDYPQAVSYLSSYSCDYNLGLAQLLNKDYSAAQKTFECVDPQDVKTNYLLAITAARQDDKAGTLDYLGKAIKLDEEVKTKATYDREFVKFEDDADFKALVGMAQ